MASPNSFSEKNAPISAPPAPARPTEPTNFSVWSWATPQISLPTGVVAARPTIVAMTATAPIAGSRTVWPRLARAATKPPTNDPAANTANAVISPVIRSSLPTSVAVNIPPPTRK